MDGSSPPALSIKGGSIDIDPKQLMPSAICNSDEESSSSAHYANARKEPDILVPSAIRNEINQYLCKKFVEAIETEFLRNGLVGKKPMPTGLPALSHHQDHTTKKSRKRHISGGKAYVYSPDMKDELGGYHSKRRYTHTQQSDQSASLSESLSENMSDSLMCSKPFKHLQGTDNQFKLSRSSKKDSSIKGVGKSKRNRLFDESTRRVLIEWMNEHINNPYCNRTEKEKLARETGLDVHQITMWFINYRRRSVYKNTK